MVDQGENVFTCVQVNYVLKLLTVAAFTVQCIFFSERFPRILCFAFHEFLFCCETAQVSTVFHPMVWRVCTPLMRDFLGGV